MSSVRNNSSPEIRALTGFLSADRIQLNVAASSKKRMLEVLSVLLSRHQAPLDRHTVFQVLNERERLGSTGIGNGIALPHGRLNGISEPQAAVLRLRQGLDFDAVDDQPVTLVIGLVVPADATEQHLKILASLAQAFSEEEHRSRILEAQDIDSLLSLLA